MKGRAETPEDKKRIMGKIQNAWLANPHLRLGQLMSNATHEVDLFSIEDESLADRLLKYSGG